MMEGEAGQLQNLLPSDMDLLSFGEEADQGELVDYEEEAAEVPSPAKQHESKRLAAQQKPLQTWQPR